MAIVYTAILFFQIKRRYFTHHFINAILGVYKPMLLIII